MKYSKEIREELVEYFQKYVTNLKVTRNYIQFHYYNTLVIIYNLDYDPFSNNGIIHHDKHLVYFDYNYGETLKLINKEFSRHPLKRLMKSFYKENPYNNLPHYQMKKDHFKETKYQSPDKELFILMDELKYRYSHKKFKLPKKGVKVQIMDKNAYLIDNKYIDLITRGWIQGDKLYTNSKIIKRVKNKEGNVTFLNPRTKKRNYFSEELKKNVNLEKESYINIKNLYTQKALLKRVEDKLVLEFNNNQYIVRHPDLLIYLLN